MNNEDSLRFVQDRLRQHHTGPLNRTLRRERRPRVTRRFAVQLLRGEARAFEKVNETVQVHCASGSLWVMHDGDCKDVILSAHESYRAQRSDAMHLFALQACVLEIAFEDEASTQG